MLFPSIIRSFFMNFILSEFKIGHIFIWTDSKRLWYNSCAQGIVKGFTIKLVKVFVWVNGFLTVNLVWHAYQVITKFFAFFQRKVTIAVGKKYQHSFFLRNDTTCSMILPF